MTLLKVLGFMFILCFLIILLENVFAWISSLFEFLTNTYWGVIALCLAIISFILFYISTHTAKDAYTKGAVIKSLEPNLQDIDRYYENAKKNSLTLKSVPMDEKIQTTQNLPGIEIDMTMNMQGVFRNLLNSINSPAPVILKGWGNKRLRLDVERVHILTEYIQSIQSCGDAFLELQADALLSEEKVQHFITIKRTKAKNELELLNKEFQDQLDLLETTKKFRKQMIEKQAALIDREVMLNSLIKSAIDNWDALKPHQAELLRSLFSQHPLVPSSPMDGISGDMQDIDKMLKWEEVINKRVQNRKSNLEAQNMKTNFDRNKDL